jgi:predicted nucleic acid-binding protein
VSGEAEPAQWKAFQDDDRFYRDTMNWDLVKREVFLLVFRYGHKASLGTLDLAIIASIRLGGATRFLSFDENLKALAEAEGIEVFPPLTAEGKAMLKTLRA